MKVLQVCAYAAPYEGNFMRSLYCLEAKLSEKGIETVYAFPESARDILWCKELSRRAKVYFLPLAKARIKPATYRKLHGIFKENADIKAAHCHFELYDVPTAFAAPKGVRVFWHLHDAIKSYTDMKNRIIHKVQYGIAHKKATLLSVSETNMEYAVKLGFPAARAFFVPNGIDTGRIKHVEKDRADRKYDFLMFGWEYEIKAVDICARAAQSRFAPKNMKIAIVGASDTEDRIAADCGGVPPSISVLSPVEDINSLYGESRVFLHISRSEGYSYALMEAVCAGLPVICSDIPENSFAKRFSTVRMVECCDADAAARAMSELGAESGYPTKDELQCAETEVRRNCSIEKWADCILEYYGF